MTYDNMAGKTTPNPVNTLAGDGKTTAARIEAHADAILRAAGSSLKHYTMPTTRAAILMAVADCYEEAMRAGAAMAQDHFRKERNDG